MYDAGIDYDDDSIKWFNILDEMNINYRSDSFIRRSATIEKLKEEILANEDAAFAYLFAKFFSYDNYLMQGIVLRKKNPKYAFLFAKNIRNCDINALQKIIIASKKINYICRFAIEIRNSPELEGIIFNSKKPKYIIQYIAHCCDNNSLSEKFKSVVLETKRPKYLFALAKVSDNQEEIDFIQELIIESGSFTYMRMFAEKIPTANVDKIERSIINSGNTKEIKKFASYVKKSKMNRFLMLG